MEGAGAGLLEVPAGCLLGGVMAAAKRRKVTFARTSALVVRQRVVIIALACLAPAAGK